MSHLAAGGLRASLQASALLVILLVLAGCPSRHLRDQLHETERLTRLYENYTRAQLARNSEDYLTAAEYARAAIEMAPNEPELWLLLGRNLRWAGLNQEAITALQEGINQSDRPLELYLELAINQDAIGDLTSARSSLRTAMELAPDVLAPHSAYAQQLARHRVFAEAIQTLEDFVELHPDNAEAWRLLGTIGREANDLPLALRAFRAARQLEPEIESNYVQSIAIARQMRDYDLAEQMAEECLVRHRQGVSCRVELIRTIDQWADEELLPLRMSLSLLQELAINLQVPLPWLPIYRELASFPVTARRANWVFSALQATSRAIGANLVRLRWVERQVQRELGSELAFRFLTSIAVDRPRNSRIQILTAWSAYRLGDEELAIKYMYHVLDVRPRSAEALNFIGYSFADRGIRLDEAEALIRSALDIWPHDGHVQDSLGWVFYRRQEYIDAVKWLAAAHYKVPDVAEIEEHLADALLALGEISRALHHYQGALRNADDERKELIRRKIDEIQSIPVS